MAREGVRIAHVDDIPAVPGQSYIEGAWKPVRTDLGITRSVRTPTSRTPGS